MKIAIFVNTPGQWHFWKNIAKGLEMDGNEVRFLFRDYLETLDVLGDVHPFIFSYNANSKYRKLLSLPFDVLRAYNYLKKIKPNLILGFGVYEAYTAHLMKSNSITFTDNEPKSSKFLEIQYKLYLPFVDVVITPESFSDNLGEKHIKVASYKEMAYLHPKYYHPRDDVLSMMGISKKEDFVLLRFNAFEGVHDVGISGFSYKDKLKLIKELNEYTQVFISSETKLPRELKRYALPVPKNRIHDVIYHAKLLVAETGTMVTEAAILGTPAVMCHGFAWKLGNFIELEKRYGMIYRFKPSESQKAVEKALELAQTSNLKKKWKKKREKLLSDKIDITAFMIWFIENYPESLVEFKEDQLIQYKFR